MVKHVILWQLKDELSDADKAKAAQDIKKGLEDLKGVIPGLVDIKVGTGPLATSSADIFLDSTFEDADALAVYATHPAHVRVKDEFSANVKSRICMDFEI